MSGHVFVSHGSDDSAEANGLAALIESKGIKAWIAPRDVRPGQDYSEQLQAAIEGCAAFVVLVSDKANKSPFVRAETEMAFSTSKPIFPVRMNDIQPAAGLAFFLKIRHWTDAFGAERDANVARLMRELQTLTGAAPDPAPTPAPSPAPSPSPPQAPARFAAVAAPPAAAVREPLPADTSLIEAAVGRNAAYFLKHWRQMDARNSSYSWNWAACLLNLFWFAYRKMWWPLIGFFVLFLMLGLVGLAGAAAGKVTLLIQIGFTFVTGGYGNRWYRNQTERLVQQTAGMSPPEALDWVRPRGGVSVPALVVMIVFAVLVSLLALVGAVTAMRLKQQANPLDQGLYRNDGGKPPPDTDGQETPPAY